MKEGSIRGKIVVDASAWLAWLLPNENVPDDMLSNFALFEREEIVFVAPELLKYEFANALQSNFLRKRIGKRDSRLLLNKMLQLKIKYLDVDFKKVLSLSFKEEISFYDASYLHLAVANKIPLLSLDKKLMEITN